MKKLLSKTIDKLTNDEELTGDESHIFGDASGLSGSVNGISGDVTSLSGSVNGISGDVSCLYGDVTSICGNVDDCEISDEERKKGIDISDLVKEVKK